MLNPEHLSLAGRYFCEFMGFDPDGDSQHEIDGQPVPNWQLATQQVKEAVAVQQALKKVLNGLDIPAPREDAPRIMPVPNLVE